MAIFILFLWTAKTAADPCDKWRELHAADNIEIKDLKAAGNEKSALIKGLKTQRAELEKADSEHAAELPWYFWAIVGGSAGATLTWIILNAYSNAHKK